MENNKTPPICSGNCKSADVKECLNVCMALDELRDAIQTDLDEFGYKDQSNAITHVVVNSMVNWMYDNVEKIKLIENK